MRTISRRTFIAGMAIAGGAARRQSVAVQQPAAEKPAARNGRTRLILLGTAGGPRPMPSSAASSQVIVVNDVAYVIDCGDGVARQLIIAGVPLTTVRHVFITHQHSDHTADYGNLMLLAWSAGLRTRVDTWGPPPLARMTKLFFEMNAADIEARMWGESREKRVPPASLVHAHELRGDGVVMSDEQVKVTAALVDHPATVPAFAYRFDARDRSIVISGDTAPSPNLAKLASGADVLVHSAMYLPAIDCLIAKAPNRDVLRTRLLKLLTTVEDAGRIAHQAGVKTLVLSHFVPADDPEVTAAMWREAAAQHFRGPIIVGKDLLEV